jgi:osmotically-inducible protein OsmY
MSKTLAAALGGLLLSGLLGGCAAVVIGGAGAGVSVAHDRRTAGTYVEDQEIELRAFRLLYDHPEIKDRSSISTTSYNLTVLLTGQAKDAEVAASFAKLVAQLPRVRQVHNEVVVGPESTLEEEANDTYLTSKVKYAMLEVKVPEFDPTRVKVITSQATVYLMGLVTAAEADAAVEKARRVSGVKRVVRVFEVVPQSQLPAKPAPSSEPAAPADIH